MEREMALALLKTHVKSDTLLKHSYAVEAAMTGYARHLGEDETRWGNCGLLHDLDFEKFPEAHPMKSEPWLIEAGFDDSFVKAIQGHSDASGVARTTPMANCLYAVDELSSFVVAVALVRPDKFEGLTSKSVIKKMKDKAFARAVSRESIKIGAEFMGLPLNEHIDHVIAYLYEQKDRLI